MTAAAPAAEPEIRAKPGPKPKVAPKAPPAIPPGSPLALAGEFVAELRRAGLADGFDSCQLARRAKLTPALGEATRAFLGTDGEVPLARALTRRLGLEAEGRRLERLPDDTGFRFSPITLGEPGAVHTPFKAAP